MTDIPGYEGLYAAEEDGSVWSLRKSIRLKPYVNTGGYMRVNLYGPDGSARHEYVHRLIANTFLPNPEDLPEINHINACRDDNRAVNLEWCDHLGNLASALKAGRWSKHVAVIAENKKTGEIRSYPFLKRAAEDLFGAWYSLNYLRSRCGDSFEKGDWIIRVEGGGAL